jgi:hypothetical protein
MVTMPQAVEAQRRAESGRCPSDPRVLDAVNGMLMIAFGCKMVLCGMSVHIQTRLWVHKDPSLTEIKIVVQEPGLELMVSLHI